jgi:hypothetical protein
MPFSQGDFEVLHRIEWTGVVTPVVSQEQGVVLQTPELKLAHQDAAFGRGHSDSIAKIEPERLLSPGLAQVSKMEEYESPDDPLQCEHPHPAVIRFRDNQHWTLTPRMSVCLRPSIW